MKSKRIKSFLEIVKVLMIPISIIFAIIVFVSSASMIDSENSFYALSIAKVVLTINIIYSFTYLLSYYYSKHKKLVIFNVIPLLHIAICIIGFVFWKYIEYSYWASLPSLVH